MGVVTVLDSVHTFLGTRWSNGSILYVVRIAECSKRSTTPRTSELPKELAMMNNSDARIIHQLARFELILNSLIELLDDDNRHLLVDSLRELKKIERQDYENRNMGFTNEPK